MSKKKSKLAKRKEKETSTYWRAKADEAWSLFIRGRDKTCLIGCSPEGYTDPCSGKLEAAHLISRGVHKHRHDPMNGLALCSKHHNFSKVISYHAALFTFVEWLREYKPDQYAWWKENSRKITYEPINFKEKHDQLVELMKVNKILK